MATNVYGTGVNSTAGENTIVHYYDRAGVKAANRVNIYGQFADRKSMPTKMGKTFKISRFEHMYDRAYNATAQSDFDKYGFMTARSLDAVNDAFLAGGDIALAEGAGDVNKQTLQKITFETSLNRYGEMIDYTDEVEIFSEDYIQVKYREELGELANSRYEDLIQLDMLETPTKMFSGTATSEATVGNATDAAAGDAIANYELIKRSVRKLVQNRAKKNTSIVTGSTKIGTQPIAKAFYAIIGADVKADLENATRGNATENGFTEWVYQPAHKYAGAASLAEGEVGAMHEVRFIESEAALVKRGAGADTSAEAVAAGLQMTNVSGTDKVDLFPILFPTEGSFATIGLKGHEKIKFNSKSPAQVENGNPYGTNGFFSYNFFYAGIILKPETLLCTWVAATA